MVMDRSGHRMAGPAMSYGAAYFDADGKLIVDDGFTTFAQMMIDWHANGLMPPDIWPALTGTKWANGNEMFFAQDVPFYMSGSWNVGNVNTNAGDAFDWQTVPVPCGPAGCGVMPGGAGFVAIKDSANPDDAGKFVAWLGSDEIAREWYGRTAAIPAHAGMQAEGIDYVKWGADEKVAEALNIFAAGAAKAQAETPQAYKLQGDKFGFVIYGATVEHLSAVMNGAMTLEEALARIRADIDEKTKG
jgi:alpha-1,4-digalacturonate transport system substrate-binding protein